MRTRVASWGGSAKGFLDRQIHSINSILEHVIEAVRETPVVFVVFLFAGFLQLILPGLLGSLATLLASFFAVLELYPVFGGEITADSSIARRIIAATLAMVIVVPILVYGGLILLLGLYLYFRIFLAVPAALVDGYSPVEALFVSWKITEGTVFTTFLAYGLTFVAAIVVFSPIHMVVGEHPLIPIAIFIIFGPIATGIQAYLYFDLEEERDE